MIQFNLLPDIKLEYIKAQRTKRTVIFLSTIIAGAALALFIMLFLLVNVAQKQHLGNLQEDIDTSKKTLEQQPELGKILTIQNQLNSITGLHEQKPVASRVYTYIHQITPTEATIATLTVNFAEQTIQIEGNADSLAVVNKYVDTLKFTTFNASPFDDNSNSETKSNAQAFSEVVLSEFSVDGTGQSGGKKPASYTIQLKYDPIIFSDASKVELIVPAGKITTRSETEKPSIFESGSNAQGSGQ